MSIEATTLHKGDTALVEAGPAAAAIAPAPAKRTGSP